MNYFKFSFPEIGDCKEKKIFIRLGKDFIFKDVIESMRVVRLNTTLAYLVDFKSFSILMISEEIVMRTK